MHWIKEYLLCVTAAAILCGIVKSMIKSKGTANTMVKLLTGLFMVITAISPWTKFDGIDITEFSDSFSLDANQSVEQGEIMARESMASLIKQNAEAYIMDKAAYLQMSISVEVTVSQEEIPKPESVVITGAASPYAKKTLCDCIVADLGIPEDALIWN